MWGTAVPEPQGNESANNLSDPGRPLRRQHSPPHTETAAQRGPGAENPAQLRLDSRPTETQSVAACPRSAALLAALCAVSPGKECGWPPRPLLLLSTEGARLTARRGHSGFMALGTVVIMGFILHKQNRTKR